MNDLNCITKESASSCNEIINNKLWIIEFQLHGIGNGCAVVKAHSAKEAENILKSQGDFNATPNRYRILRIEEIIESPSCMLICEQISVNDDN